MSAQTTITGWNLEGSEETRVWTEDVPDVHVSLAGEARTNGDEYAGAAYRCTACGEALDDEGETVDGPDHTSECTDNPLDEPDEEGREYGPHVAVPIPLAWANSASIRADEGRDTLTVAISVGDPRGAFTLSVERIRFTDEEGRERDELRLSVPTPEDGFPHMTLTPLASPGYYRIS